MVKFIELEPQVFVAGQIAEDDFAEIAASGFRAVVNNRPDGEAAGQMPDDVAAPAARRHGLDYVYQPVANLNVTEEVHVEAFRQSLDELPRPVLFYCRTGTRCTILWAQASAARLSPETVLKAAADAGYDLYPVREMVDRHAERLRMAERAERKPVK
jgi:sulfide:quinone oxidoreductase